MAYNEYTMEPDTPTKASRRAAPPRPKAAKPASGGAARSSHIIDLRQQPPAAGLKEAAERPAPPKPKQSPQPKPVQKPAPELPPLTESIDVVDSRVARKRFWPAFGRFLLLMLILGAIIAASLYIYLTYFLQA